MNQEEMLNKLDRIIAQLAVVNYYEDNAAINSIQEELVEITENIKEFIDENKPTPIFDIKLNSSVDTEQLEKDFIKELHKLGVTGITP